MNWRLDPDIDLHSCRVPDEDADRQTRTAAEVLRRLQHQPGVILADEVGMGKTYVALAVAASTVTADPQRRPVLVMVPPAVADKWPAEWQVFSELCLPSNHGLRAPEHPVRRGSDLLKLLDDPPDTRHHLIFVTYGALTRTLNDPFVQLVLLRQATLRQREGSDRRRAIAKFAGRLLSHPPFHDTELVEELLESPPARWRRIWDLARPDQVCADDPVPTALLAALNQVDLTPLREALETVPINRSQNLADRLQRARKRLCAALDAVWRDSLAGLDIHLPLLILDEAHHVKNDNRVAGQFSDAGPLGHMVDRMLFLTATPFQLGHHELLSVLRRFHGVRWGTETAKADFDQRLTDLGRALDRARATALRLERAWGRIDPADAPLVADAPSLTLEGAPAPVTAAFEVARETRDHLREAERLLRPWVIRHQRPHTAERRRYIPGRGIVDDRPSDRGLAVDGSATLPFLLAARAQALAALNGEAGRRATKALYAYGLASSFEAYHDTRRNRAAALDEEPETGTHQDGAASLPDSSRQLAWYLERIGRALPSDQADGWAGHPKVKATVDRTLELWRRGEKALVFCFYFETGRALRAHISRALRSEITIRAAHALGYDPQSPQEVFAELDRIGERLLRSDARGYQEFGDYIRTLTGGLDAVTAERVAEITTRFMRTPSFLVRFTKLTRHITVTDLITGLEQPDASGATLAGRLRTFSQSVAELVEGERQALLAALAGVQTGGINVAAEDVDPFERPLRRELLLPNVRLANGRIHRDTRRRLMLTFNTPYFPEILVASAVMAEGVDLHRDCRHVIHHDLDWSPSTLEQRTGRIDRINSKAARTSHPVVIYEPYIAGTHDEKMFRVVKDRERWFNVVMGQTPDISERATEQVAARVPLPDALTAALTMDLAVNGQDSAVPRQVEA
jgi:superfamily II DNA or RNA helicase